MRRPSTGGGGGGGGPTLSSLAITPTSPTIAHGDTVQFTATGTYSDASTLNLTSAVTWSSTDTSFATITNGSGGGLASIVGVTGGTTIGATLLSKSDSVAISMAAVLFRASSPIPNVTITSSSSPGVVYSRPILVPSDVSQITMRMANTRLYTGGTTPSVSNFAMYNSNGSGLPTGPALQIQSGQTIPADGSDLILPSVNFTRGTDGMVIFVFSLPVGVDVGISQFNAWGHYNLGTVSVTPAPNTPDNVDPNPPFWTTYDYLTTRPRWIVVGDSLSVGVGTTNTPGLEQSAWYLLGKNHDFAMGIYGMPGSVLPQFADIVTYPKFWSEIIPSGANAFIECGVNDLGSRTAAQMEADLTTIVTRLRSLGINKVYACTLAPQTFYSDTQRPIYNSFLLANSLALNGVVDLDVTLRDPTNITVLNPAYDTGDGVHWDAAGHLAALSAIEAVVLV